VNYVLVYEIFTTCFKRYMDIWELYNVRTYVGSFMFELHCMLCVHRCMTVRCQDNLFEPHPPMTLRNTILMTICQQWQETCPGGNDAAQQILDENAHILLFDGSRLIATPLLLNACRTHGCTNLFTTELFTLLKNSILPNREA